MAHSASFSRPNISVLVNQLGEALFGDQVVPNLATQAIGGETKTASVRSRNDEIDGVPNIFAVAEPVDGERIDVFVQDPAAAPDLPNEIQGVPVLVVQSAPALAGPPNLLEEIVASASAPAALPCSLNKRSRQRPLIAGISAGHFNITAGTLGCFCHSTVAGETGLMALSNNHVFADSNSASIGDRIRQPGKADGGTSADEIGSLLRFVPIVMSSTARNEVDAAICTIDSSITVTPDVCSIGALSGTATATRLLAVRKHGRTTGLTEGQVTHIGMMVVVGYGGVGARFVNQIRIAPTSPFTAFSAGGDSGSIIVEKESQNAVALLFAGPSDNSYTLANPIAQVLALLNIAIP